MIFLKSASLGSGSPEMLATAASFFLGGFVLFSGVSHRSSDLCFCGDFLSVASLLAELPNEIYIWT